MKTPQADGQPEREFVRNLSSNVRHKVEAFRAGGPVVNTRRFTAGKQFLQSTVPERCARTRPFQQRIEAVKTLLRTVHARVRPNTRLIRQQSALLHAAAEVLRPIGRDQMGNLSPHSGFLGKVKLRAEVRSSYRPPAICSTNFHQRHRAHLERNRKSKFGSGRIPMFLASSVLRPEG